MGQAKHRKAFMEQAAADFKLLGSPDCPPEAFALAQVRLAHGFATEAGTVLTERHSWANTAYIQALLSDDKDTTRGLTHVLNSMLTYQSHSPEQGSVVFGLFCDVTQPEGHLIGQFDAYRPLREVLAQKLEHPVDQVWVSADATLSPACRGLPYLLMDAIGSTPAQEPHPLPTDMVEKLDWHAWSHRIASAKVSDNLAPVTEPRLFHVRVHVASAEAAHAILTRVQQLVFDKQTVTLPYTLGTMIELAKCKGEPASADVTPLEAMPILEALKTVEIYKGLRQLGQALSESRSAPDRTRVYLEFGIVAPPAPASTNPDSQFEHIDEVALLCWIAEEGADRPEGRGMTLYSGSYAPYAMSHVVERLNEAGIASIFLEGFPLEKPDTPQLESSEAA